MANTVTVTKLNEGQKTATFHVFLASDNASGELTDQVLIDPAVDFSPALVAGKHISIMEIWYSLIGFDATLEFDAGTDVPVLVLGSAQSPAHECYRVFGGLADRSGSSPTGKLQITTTGFTATGDRAHIIIMVQKNGTLV